MKANFRTIIFSITLFLVVFAIGIGFFLTGGPKHQRKVQLDVKRAKIINELSRKIGIYYKENNKLPKELTEIAGVKDITAKDGNTIKVVSLSKYRDPVSTNFPDYRILSEDKFELCLTYATSNLSFKNKNNYRDYNNYDSRQIKHKEGYHCSVYNKNNDKKDSYIKFKLEE